MRLGLLLLLVLYLSNGFGQEFSWALSLGGEGFDDVDDFAVDASGNIYLTGDFDNIVDFDPGEGEELIDPAGGTDGYILKLDKDQKFVWVRHLDGVERSEQLPASIALDADGSILVSGEFTDQTNFNPLGSDGVVDAVGRDGYLVKFDNNGTFQWVHHLAGARETEVLSVSIDKNNDYYITGFYEGIVEFGDGVVSQSAGNSEDIFLQKLTSAGEPLWSKFLGSSENERGQYVLAHDEHLYFTGYYKEQIDFDTDEGEAVVSSLEGSSDAFIQKMTLDGDHLWVRSFGGGSIDEGIAIAIDSEENVLLGGDYLSTAYFNEDQSIFFENIIGAGFLLKLSAVGELTWVKAVRTPGALAIDPQDNIYTVGSFEKPFDFDPSEDELILEGVNGTNGFLQKFDPDGNHVWVKQLEKIQGSGTTEVKSVEIDQVGNIYLGGNFWETIDFDPGSNSFELMSSKWRDGFLMQLETEITRVKIPDISHQFKVYPNPVENNIHFTASDNSLGAQVRIIDPLGRQLWSTSMQLEHQNQVSLPATLVAGFYNLSIWTSSGFANLKFLKM